MSDNRGGLRDWIERLSRKIPGYNGYVDKERRRDMDKLHREHMADRLRSFKAPLTDLMRELTSTGRLLEVGAVDLALKKLDRIENRIRFASYGYSGFFDAVRIEEQQLDSIYSFDLAMVEHIDRLETKIGELKVQAGTPEGLKKGSAELVNEIDSTDRAFDDRYKAINNFGHEQAPGKPLFS